VLFGGRIGSGLEGLDFSQEGMKRVVGLFTGFVSAMASAPNCFLYLEQRIHDIKKKKKKKMQLISLTTGGCKPRVAFYVYSSFLSTISLLPRFFGIGDVMALDLFTPDVFFNPSTTGFRIINSYSTKGRSNNTRSVPQDINFPSSHLPTLTLGELNIDYATADPL